MVGWASFFVDIARTCGELGRVWFIRSLIGG